MVTATTATKERKGQQEEKEEEEEEEEGGRGLSKIECISSNELITTSFFLTMQPSANRYEV